MIRLNSKLRNLLGTHGQPKPQKTNMPLFITGCMRSGTTFLVNKLTAHPQLLRIGSELNEIWTEIGGASIINHCDFKNEQDASGYYTYQMGNYFFHFIKESESIKRHLMRANTYYSRKLGRITYDWENIIPINKSPHLMNKIGYVNKLFPGSKNILIIRDIFAHSSSMKAHFDNSYDGQFIHVMSHDPKACWSSYEITESDNKISLKYYPQNFELIPQMWIRLNKLALQTISKLDKDQYIVICYEDLINDQEEKFKKIFNFLQLEEKHRKHESKISGSLLNFKNTTTKGDPLNKWKKNLLDEEVELINETIDELKSDYAYIRKTLDERKI